MPIRSESKNKSDDKAINTKTRNSETTNADSNMRKPLRGLTEK